MLTKTVQVVRVFRRTVAVAGVSLGQRAVDRVSHVDRDVHRQPVLQAARRRT